MTDDEKAILRLLARHPGGIRQADVMITTGLTPHAVTTGLRSLRAAGLADVMRHGKRASWGTPENCLAIKAERDRVASALVDAKTARAVERKSRREIDAERMRLAYEKKRADEAAAEEFARKSIVIHVAQSAWVGQAPVVGVPSVFHLGGLQPISITSAPST